MDRFEIIEEIDEGAFGIVLLAKNKENKEIVAIKKIKEKFKKWEDCMNLKEISSLRKLKHPNIIKLKEVFKLENELFLVFEYCEKNLFRYYTENFKQKSKKLPEIKIKKIIYQITKALSYMHKKGFFHRDMKPENLLINSSESIKIADFGLAREIRSSPPYTDYVSTRWYRAPEILLKSHNYNSPVDIFALGCIMAELYMQEPLFKGNSELDQMNKICAVLGTPSKSWVEGYKLAGQIGFVFPEYEKRDLREFFEAGEDAVDLILNMLTFESCKRISASKMLGHKYFDEVREKEDFEVLKKKSVLGKESHLRKVKVKKFDFYDGLFKGESKSRRSSFNYLKYQNKTDFKMDNKYDNVKKNKIDILDYNLLMTKTNNKENCLEESPQFDKKFQKTPEKIDQLLEEFHSGYKNLETKRNYINTKSNKKLKDIEKNMNLGSNKKLIKKNINPSNKNVLISFFENNCTNSKINSKNLIDDQIEELLNSTPFKNKKNKSKEKNILLKEEALLNEIKSNKSTINKKFNYKEFNFERPLNNDLFDKRRESKDRNINNKNGLYYSYLTDVNKLNKYAKQTYPYNF